MSNESSFDLDSFINDLIQRYPLDKFTGIISAEALVNILRKNEREISIFLSDKAAFGAGPSAFRIVILPKGQSLSEIGTYETPEFFGLAVIHDTYNYLKQMGFTKEQIGLVGKNMSKFTIVKGRSASPENYQQVSIDELDMSIRKRQATLGL